MNPLMITPYLLAAILFAFSTMIYLRIHLREENHKYIHIYHLNTQTCYNTLLHINETIKMPIYFKSATSNVSRPAALVSLAAISFLDKLFLYRLEILLCYS